MKIAHGSSRTFDGLQTLLAIGLILAAVGLRILLLWRAPLPFGYVYDHYDEGVVRLYESGTLPQAADCWQCYHPPLFYLLGLPFYSFGMWMTGGRSFESVRYMAVIPMVSGILTVCFGVQLVRYYFHGGWERLFGLALLLVFPCLFISSYGVEADIVLTAIMSAFFVLLCRWWEPKRSLADAGEDLPEAPSGRRDWHVPAAIGLLAGLAAATKYNGLVAITVAGVVIGAKIVLGPGRRAAMRAGVLVAILCAVIGAWKYVDNIRRYGTPLFANGTAAEGFAVAGRRFHWDYYDFLSFRLADLIRVTGGEGPPGMLTDLPVYRSVWTTLHGLGWSDMSFFSEPTRHGDGPGPYPHRPMSVWLAGPLLTLALVPNVLSLIGFAATVRRRDYWPLAAGCLLTFLAYAAWFLSQRIWALKTKYILFLLPLYVVYVLAGLEVLGRWRQPVRLAALALLAILIVVAHVYLFVFAVGVSRITNF